MLKSTEKNLELELAQYFSVSNWFKLMLCGNKNDLQHLDHKQCGSHVYSVLLNWDYWQLNNYQAESRSAIDLSDAVSDMLCLP